MSEEPGKRSVTFRETIEEIPAATFEDLPEEAVEDISERKADYRQDKRPGKSSLKGKDKRIIPPVQPIVPDPTVPRLKDPDQESKEEYKRETHFAKLIGKVGLFEERAMHSRLHQVLNAAQVARLADDELDKLPAPVITVAITETAVSGPVTGLLPLSADE